MTFKLFLKVITLPTSDILQTHQCRRAVKGSNHQNYCLDSLITGIICRRLQTVREEFKEIETREKKNNKKLCDTGITLISCWKQQKAKSTCRLDRSSQTDTLGKVLWVSLASGWRGRSINRKSVWLTCGIALNDWQVIHLQSGITPTPRKLHYVVFAVIYKLWRLLDVNVVRSDIKHNSNVSFLLEKEKHRRGDAFSDSNFNLRTELVFFLTILHRNYGILEFHSILIFVLISPVFSIYTNNWFSSNSASPWNTPDLWSTI